jgi:hypothetical protein
MAVITDKEAAKRCARAIASDLALYNEAKIKEGIENDTFFEVLEAEIEEGREYYKSKVAPDIYQKCNYYDRALIDVILKYKANIKSKIW